MELQKRRRRRYFVRETKVFCGLFRFISRKKRKKKKHIGTQNCTFDEEKTLNCLSTKKVHFRARLHMKKKEFADEYSMNIRRKRINKINLIFLRNSIFC